MKIERCTALPLITHDPYFSIWDVADTLNAADMQHWSGIRQRLRGWLEVDGVRYRFLGDGNLEPVAEQTEADLSATTTAFSFTAAGVTLNVSFTSPLLADEPELAARPVTYLRFAAKDCAGRKVRVLLAASADPVCMTPNKLLGGCYHTEKTSYAYIGRAEQHPLGHSGDKVTADWGWLYLASRAKDAQMAFDEAEGNICAGLSLTEGKEETIAVGMDDIASICYFGEIRKGLWTKRWPTILSALEAALDDEADTLVRCEQLDQKIENAAMNLGGADYALLCLMSYRLSFSAHKLIADENGDIIFLSKENDSNGCIGTVDVTYPSSPLYLLLNPELVKGMLRPVFRFSEYPVWEFDFAPHDVGRYPYAWGQVYGVNNWKLPAGPQYPPFYQYPAGNDTYGLRNQMPVEESANMLILTAAVCLCDGKADFALPYMDTLKMWVQYLETYGEDPGEQLCTDDFAGHLAHNVNLSAKAIMGIEAFAQLHRLLGDDEAARIFHEKAAAMAKSWCKRAEAGDHTRLVFDKEEGWSLKYNLVWDKIFGSKLFSQNLFEAEAEYYISQGNDFGTPLDSRETYTKSDWIMWSAALSDSTEKLQKLAAPIARFVKESPDRIPFSDWYFTKTGRFRQFRGRSVQGGIFMPLLVKLGLGNKQ